MSKQKKSFALNFEPYSFPEHLLPGVTLFTTIIVLIKLLGGDSSSGMWLSKNFYHATIIREVFVFDHFLRFIPFEHSKCSIKVQFIEMWCQKSQNISYKTSLSPFDIVKFDIVKCFVAMKNIFAKYTACGHSFFFKEPILRCSNWFCIFNFSYIKPFF